MDEKLIEQFIQNNPKGHFAQSAEWGLVKKDWKRDTVCVTDGDGSIIGAIAFLIRRIPGMPWSLMYAPRGPVCDVDNFEVLSALIEKSRELARRNRAYIIKIDPDVPVDNTAFISEMEKLGFSRNAGKNFDAVQPNFVFRLNIAGKTPDEVFAAFASKTRYNIRVAERSGVTVRLGGSADVAEFTRIMRITGQRDGFTTRPKSYFDNLLTSMGDDARLYVAEHEGRMIAATIAISYGNKTWYLYGASDNNARNLMPNYLLQWEMIKWAFERGSDIYDFRGVSGDLSPDNPLYGLYRFKKGFSGEFTEFCGEFNLILKPGAYRTVAFAMKCRHALGRLTRKQG